MLKVIVSPLAEKKINLLLNYLETEWSKRTRDKFLIKLYKSFDQVARQPRSCRESEAFPSLFQCTVTSQTSFYYRIVADHIEIITIIDNRQAPSVIMKELKSWREQD